MLGCLISTPLSFDQGELTGGRVRFGRWVPQEKKCGRAGEGTRLKAAKADLPWDAARMLRAYNATLDDAVELAVREKYDDFTYKKAVHQCDQLDGAAAAIRVAEAAENRVANPQAVESTEARRWRCDAHARLGAAGVGLLIGVHTSPMTQVRRIAIRRTWAAYSSNASLVCFIVGLAGLSEAVQQSLREESTTHGDLVLLPDVEDGRCHITIQKAHGWWRWAANTGVGHVARVDDDAFVHIPRLEAALAPLRCHPRLVFGALAYVGYNPATFRKCGYSWGGDRAWRRYGCASGGSHRPSLFPSGMLQVLSAPVVAALDASSTISEFVRRSRELIDLRDWDRTEDVALGFWLHQLLAEGKLPRIVYARASSSAAHNLGCQKHDSLYRNPRASSVVVHYVKKPSGMEYLQRVFAGAPHVGKACTRAAGVG